MGVVTLFIYWFCVGVLYFVVGIPYIIFNLSIHCLQRGFKEDCSIVCRLVAFVLIEMAFYLCVVLFKKAFPHNADKCPTTITRNPEEEANRLMENSKLSQTPLAWKNQIESDEKDFLFYQKEFRLTLKRQAKKKHDTVIKYKKTRSILEKGLESKTKLLSTIKAKTVSLALDTETMIQQIKSSKATLERLKNQNEQAFEQYAQLADQIKWDYSQQIMNDQGENFYISTNGQNY